jgi:hypothetical protein
MLLVGIKPAHTVEEAACALREDAANRSVFSSSGVARASDCARLGAMSPARNILEPRA